MRSDGDLVLVSRRSWYPHRYAWTCRGADGGSGDEPTAATTSMGTTLNELERVVSVGSGVWCMWDKRGSGSRCVVGSTVPGGKIREDALARL